MQHLKIKIALYKQYIYFSPPHPPSLALAAVPSELCVLVRLHILALFSENGVSAVSSFTVAEPQRTAQGRQTRTVLGASPRVFQTEHQGSCWWRWRSAEWGAGRERSCPRGGAVSVLPKS